MGGRTRDDGSSSSSSVSSSASNRGLRRRFFVPVELLLMALLLLAELGLCVALLVSKDSRVNRYSSSTENTENREMDLIWIQFFAAVVTLAVTVGECMLLLNVVLTHQTARLFGLMILGVVGLAGAVINTASPTSERLKIVIALIVFQSLFLIVLFALLMRTSRAKVKPKRTFAMSTSCARLHHGEVLNFLTSLDDWLEVRHLRARLAKHLRRGRTYYLTLCALVLILGLSSWVFNFVTIISTQGEFFTPDRINRMNERSDIESYFGPNRTQSHWKVVMVLIDGWRFDALSNVDTQDFLQSARMQGHTRVLQMRTQLPSMSVPNWVTSLTGAPPEMSGVIGNLNVPETRLDSIFQEAKNYDANRGLTGSPWMSDIVMSTLPFLQGDGTISPSTMPKENGVEIDLGASADYADDLRGQVANQAISQAVNPYQLFLAHFSDADTQGHALGVKTKFNGGNTYYRAVSNKTRLTRAMEALMDDNTVMFVFADHGHVDRGGHGGTEDVLTHVPLIIHAPNSNLATATYSGPSFEGEVENIDLAPTVAAILGMPVPRQAKGRFINAAMPFISSDPAELRLHFLDLFKQKQAMVRNFVEALATATDLDEDLLYGDHLSETTEWYRDQVDALLEIMDDERAIALELGVVRNLMLILLVNVVILVAVIYTMHAHTFCDLRALVCCFFCCASCRRRMPINQTKNIVAFFWSFFGVLVYYGFTIAAFLVLYAAYGYESKDWESTLIHTPAVVPRYVAYVLAPGILASFVLFRSYHIAGMRFRRCVPDISCHQRLAVYLSNFASLFSDSSAIIDRADHIYLCRHYTLFFIVLSILVIFFLEGTFTSFIPLLFQIPFIDEELWSLRFRLLTVHMMAMPLMIGGMIEVYLSAWGADNYKSSKFDSVYLLKVQKDQFHDHRNNDHDFATAQDQVDLLKGTNADAFLGIHTPMQLLHAVVPDVHAPRTNTSVPILEGDSGDSKSLGDGDGNGNGDEPDASNGGSLELQNRSQPPQPSGDDSSSYGYSSSSSS